MALIEVQHLKKYFDVPNGTLHAAVSYTHLTLPTTERV